jgi:hypothetical protein
LTGVTDMTDSDSRLRGLLRTVVVSMLSLATIAGGAVSSGVATADCNDPARQASQNDTCVAVAPATVPGDFRYDPAGVVPPWSAPSFADMRPSTMRALCAISACFLITDRPGAGIGGKT